MKLRLAILTLFAGFMVPSASFAKETKDVSYKFKNADPVVFSHDIHLEKYRNNCKVCHNAIFDLRKRKHFTMAEMEKTKSCGGCHNGVKAFSVADDRSCTKCHKGKPRNIVYKMKNAGEAAFSHDLHVSKTSGKCRSCHNGKVITGTEKAVTMAEMEKGKTCGACHNDKQAFTVAGNCGKCHKGMQPKDLTFKVKGATGAVFSHNFHLGMYSCKDCHTNTFPYKAGVKHVTMAEMEKGKSCGICHNGKDAFSAGGDCVKCHKGYVPPAITFKNDGGEVKFSHELHLGMYKCEDCHTKVFPYKAGAKHVSMTAMETGESCGTCHNAKDAFSVKGDCEKCHKM